MNEPQKSDPIFTPSDVRALVRGPTADERAAVAFKLCRKIDTELTNSDRAAANEILRVMAGDAAELVRRALAITLRSSDVLPRDIALRLADDVETIANPVLSFSPVFSDADLADIVRRADPSRQVAVAKRAALSEIVTDAIAEYGCEQAVNVAASNDGASFSETGLVICLDRFRNSQPVANAIAYRKVLPAAVTEKLVHMVSEEVRKHLIDKHNVGAEAAMFVAVATQERATVDVLDEIAEAEDMEAFVKHLHHQNRLTPSLLLRASTSGYMKFMEHAMAVLAAVPHHRAWLLIHDAGDLGFKAIFERSGMPQRLYSAFKVALDTFHTMGVEGKVQDQATFQALLLERFLTQTHSAPKEDIDYLLQRLDTINSQRRSARLSLAGAA